MRPSNSDSEFFVFDNDTNGASTNKKPRLAGYVTPEKSRPTRGISPSPPPKSAGIASDLDQKRQSKKIAMRKYRANRREKLESTGTAKKLDEGTGKLLSMDPDAIAMREYRAKRREELESTGIAKKLDEGTGKLLSMHPEAVHGREREAEKREKFLSSGTAKKLDEGTGKLLSMDPRAIAMREYMREYRAKRREKLESTGTAKKLDEGTGKLLSMHPEAVCSRKYTAKRREELESTGTAKKLDEGTGKLLSMLPKDVRARNRRSVELTCEICSVMVNMGSVWGHVRSHLRRLTPACRKCEFNFWTWKDKEDHEITCVAAGSAVVPISAITVNSIFVTATAQWNAAAVTSLKLRQELIIPETADNAVFDVTESNFESFQEKFLNLQPGNAELVSRFQCRAQKYADISNLYVLCSDVSSAERVAKTCFYVGKTIQPRRRIRQHASFTREAHTNPDKAAIIQSLDKLHMIVIYTGNARIVSGFEGRLIGLFGTRFVNIALGAFVGYEEYNVNGPLQLSTLAIEILIRGILQNWNQPVSSDVPKSDAEHAESQKWFEDNEDDEDGIAV